MGGCYVCDSDRGLSYTCNYCDREYCSEHRLPEAHECHGLRKKNPSTHDTVEPTVMGTTPDPDYESSPDVAPDGRIAATSRTSNDTAGSPTTGDRFRVYLTLGVLAIVLITTVAGAHYGAFSTNNTVDPPPIASGSSTATSGGGTQPTDTQTTEAATSGADDGTLDAEAIELAIHTYVNQERQERGLQKLSYDSELASIGRYHSKDMVDGGYFAHTSPSGESMTDRYAKFGYDCRAEVSGNRYSTGAENIAMTYAFTRVETSNGTVERYDSADEVAKAIVRQWMQSPGHRENILKSYWNGEGVGVYITVEDGDTAIYATQNFC